MSISFEIGSENTKWFHSLPPPPLSAQESLPSENDHTFTSHRYVYKITYAYRIITCGSHYSDINPPMPGLSYSPTPTESSLGDRDINHVSANAWSQLLAHAYRIITWGSHYSDINHLSANAWYQLLAHAYRIITWGSHYSDINHVSTK
jgi:hypothetical protein